MPLRIPFDPDYTALLGRATYVFAYYEWAVIHLIEQFRPGFLNRYCRGKPMTSGDVKRALEEIMKGLRHLVHEDLTRGASSLLHQLRHFNREA